MKQNCVMEVSDMEKNKIKTKKENVVGDEFQKVANFFVRN